MEEKRKELQNNIIEIINRIEDLGRLEYICEFIRLLQEYFPVR